MMRSVIELAVEILLDRSMPCCGRSVTSFPVRCVGITAFFEA